MTSSGSTSTTPTTKASFTPLPTTPSHNTTDNSNSNNNRSLRYHLLRFCYCPCSQYLYWINPNLPLVGSRSCYEIFLILITFIILLALSFSLSSSESVGSLADKLGALMIVISLRKMNIFTWSFGISFEHCLYYHKVIACFTILTVWIHGCREWAWNSNLSGVLAFVLLIVIALSYMIVIYYPSWFNSFYFTHILLTTVTIPILAIHGASFFAFAGFIWYFDMFTRYGLHNQIVTAKIQLLATRCIRIEFPMLYEMTKPGQYCFLMIKNINNYEYHPFSIASANHQSNNLFYVHVIESEGNTTEGGTRTGSNNKSNIPITWTEKLKKLCLTVDSGDKGIGEGIVEMSVEGPYGSLSIDLMDHETYPVLVLIAGGIGITPMLGLVNHLLHQFQKGCSDSLERVLLVWSVNDRELGDALYRDYLMPIMEDSEEIHQSTIQSVMTFSPFHDKAQGSQKVNGGVINIPKRGVFEFHLHLTGGRAGKQQQHKHANGTVSGTSVGTAAATITATQQGSKTISFDTDSHTPEDESHKGMLHPHLWKFGRPNIEAILTDAGKLCHDLNCPVTTSCKNNGMNSVSSPVPSTRSSSGTNPATLSPLHARNMAVAALNNTSDHGSSFSPQSSPVKQSSGTSFTSPYVNTATQPTKTFDSRYVRRVGVMVAGPQSLREDVRAICSRRRELFDLHEEAFSL